MARMQGKTTSDISQLFAGIDVSKAHLDLQLSCERRSRRFANDPAGFAAIDAHLRARADTPCLVALEPTGRYHFPVWRALHEAGHGVAPLNPLHVRRFAESDGELAKPVPGPIGEPMRSTPLSWPGWPRSAARPRSSRPAKNSCASRR
jgi:hypothetical protein